MKVPKPKSQLPLKVLKILNSMKMRKPPKPYNGKLNPKNL